MKGSDMHSNDAATMKAFAQMDRLKEIPDKEKPPPGKLTVESPWLKSRDAHGFLKISRSKFWKEVHEDTDAPDPYDWGGLMLWSRKELSAWAETKKGWKRK